MGCDMSRFKLLLGPRGYAGKVRSMRPGHTIGYWPLWEASGSVAEDISGNGFHGAYSNVTLGATGIGDGHTAASFNGTSSYVLLPTAAGAALNATTGTLLSWAKVANAGVWTDATSRSIARIGPVTGSGSYAEHSKSATSNRITTTYRGGGTVLAINQSSVSDITWMCLAHTWDKNADQLKSYRGGVQIGSTATGLPTMTSGTPIAIIGASVATPSALFAGSIAYVTLLDVVLSAAEIAALAVPA